MISIIVPVYNVEAYLQQCLKSIVAQTFTNLEIILVDDGSTDSSGVICDAWQQQDKRIRVIHQDNGGLSHARNVGMKAATGDYIAFVDSDDVLHERMYEFMMDALQKTNADVAICHEDAFYEEVYQSRHYDTCHIERVEDTEALMKHFMLAWTGVINFAWNKLYKKEIVQRISFPVGRKMEDMYFSADALSKVSKAVWLEERLYGYRQRSGSIMNSEDESIYAEHAQAILFQKSVFQRESYNAYALCKLAHLELEARQRGMNEGAKSVRRLFLRLYEESDIRSLSLKNKCKVMLARYQKDIYYLLHKQNKQLLVKNTKRHF